MIRRRHHWFIVVVVLLIGSSVSIRAGVPAAPTATIVVTSLGDTNTNDGTCTLREAITAANTNTASGAAVGECVAGGATDTITFTPAVSGTLQLSRALPTIDNNLSVSGPGTALLTIRRNQGRFRIFEITGGNVAMSGLTLTNGSAQEGGGILNRGSLTLSRMQISGNTAQNGAGIENLSAITITDSLITDNIAIGSGGGLQSLSGTFTTTLRGVHFEGNRAEYGGAINSYEGVLIEHSTLMRNTATLEGGALHHVGSGLVVITASTIVSNTASTGSGVAHRSGSLLVEGSTFSGNQGTGVEGAALFVAGLATASIQRSTIVNNTVTTTAPRIGAAGVEGAGVATLIGTIVARNIPTDLQAGNLVSTSYNLIGDCSQGGGPMSLRNINPQLGPLQNNGGPTLTHALLPNSPAINTGNPTFAPPPATDQRGVGFPRVQQARIDIGAFESTFAAPDPLPAATVCARLLLPFVSR